MSELRGKALYEAALKRLETGDTKVVNTSDPDFRFSTTTVAVEAGKKKGFIRNDRYPDLCKKIEKAEEARKLASHDAPKKKKNTSDARITKLSEQYDALKEDYELCLEKMLNLIRENFELKKTIRKQGYFVPHIDFRKDRDKGPD